MNSIFVLQLKETISKGCVLLKFIKCLSSISILNITESPYILSELSLNIFLRVF